MTSPQDAKITEITRFIRKEVSGVSKFRIANPETWTLIWLRPQACIDANGNITRSAELILLAMMKPLSVEQVAAESGLAVFRIRSALRELTQAGFVSQAADMFQITEEGQKALEGRKGKEES